MKQGEYWLCSGLDHKTYFIGQIIEITTPDRPDMSPVNVKNVATKGKWWYNLNSEYMYYKIGDADNKLIRLLFE